MVEVVMGAGGKTGVGRWSLRIRRTASAFLLGTPFWLSGASVAVAADTFVDALAQAYRQNPTLEAARAHLRSVDEQLPEALAGARPEARITTGVKRTWDSIKYSQDPSSTGAYTSRTMEATVTQPLYQGGQTEAKTRGAQNRIMAERSALLSTEQSVLLAAIKAYMGIIRDQAILKLYVDYQKVLQQRLEIERRRLKIGENTKTDVSQAESRLALAIASRIQAENNLHSSIADYVQAVGAEPGKLLAPKLSVELPASFEEVVETAREANPNVVAARFSEASARDDVDAIDGQLLPTVQAVGSFSRVLNPGIGESREDTATIGVQMILPLDNGTVTARARGARQTVSQRMLQIQEEQRRAINQASRDWNDLIAARASIRSREIQVRSANVGLASLRDEVDIGARTVTDLLNAEQEALVARTALVQAQTDEVVRSLALLADVGRLTVQNLKLPVEFYDYEAHYRQVRGKIWSVSITGDPK